MSDNQQTERADDIIDACHTAQKHCQRGLAAVLEAGSDAASQSVLTALMDCSLVNAATADLVARNSPHAGRIVLLNADISSSCARAIEKFEHDDGLLRSTYASCLRASDACRSFGTDMQSTEESVRDKTVADSFPASDPPPPPTEL